MCYSNGSFPAGADGPEPTTGSPLHEGKGWPGPEEAAGAGTTQGLTGGPGSSPGPGAAAQPPSPEPQLWSRAGQGQEASAERAAACRQTQPLSSGCSPKS